MRLPTHRPPTHPGEILLHEFLAPLGMTQAELARRIHLPLRRVNRICNGQAGVTPDGALRLNRLFGTSPGFWLNLQSRYDLYRAARAPEASSLRKIEPLPARRNGRSARAA
jgi:antitoxin HigA-1